MGIQKQNQSLEAVHTYSGPNNYQPYSAIVQAGAGVGSNTSTAPRLIAGVNGEITGASLTKAANYLAGVIGQYGLTGTKSTTYPAGAVLGSIEDGVTEADGAVVAFIDGDSEITTANAAFKAMMNNSTSGSGFNYGLDLFGASHDGYFELAILKAAIRMDKEVCILQGAGVPTDGTSGDGAAFAEIGSTYHDRTNGKLYVNGGTKASPTWKLVTSAA